jgi:fido (protein-threonine AMPylation protein)
MSPANTHNFPEIFRPQDSRWASRAAARGEIRRLARGVYTTNLQETPERLVRRRWYDVAALYFPDAVIVDRSAVLAGPSDDGSLFLDVGEGPTNPRPVLLPGLTLRPRNGSGPIEGDVRFIGLHMSSQARIALENLRPSRARLGVSRTLRRDEFEQWLERIARARGDAALGELRDNALKIAPALGATTQLEQLNVLIGALLGTREAPLQTTAARARRAGLAYDPDRLELLETLRAELARQAFASRPEPPDPERLLAFFEGYFSNWIEGTVFDVREAEQIVFEGHIPIQRPADAHDVRGTFEAITDARLRSSPPRDVDELEDYTRTAHRLVMGGHPEVAPGEYKQQANRAGMTIFVRPDLVRGTLREGFALLDTLHVELARAIFAMFLIAEVHPFTDGNGRVARLVMNAELSLRAQCRIMIPLSYRDEYLTALRALSQGRNPRPLWRVIDRAQRWASLMTWTDHEHVLHSMRETNALVTPEETSLRNLHLLDPA